jgi:hypothetical protein
MHFFKKKFFLGFLLLFSSIFFIITLPLISKSCFKLILSKILHQEVSFNECKFYNNKLRIDKIILFNKEKDTSLTIEEIQVGINPKLRDFTCNLTIDVFKPSVFINKTSFSSYKKKKSKSFFNIFNKKIAIHEGNIYVDKDQKNKICFSAKKEFSSPVFNLHFYWPKQSGSIDLQIKDKKISAVCCNQAQLKDLEPFLKSENKFFLSGKVDGSICFEENLKSENYLNISDFSFYYQPALLQMKCNLLQFKSKSPIVIDKDICSFLSILAAQNNFHCQFANLCMQSMNQEPFLQAVTGSYSFQTFQEPNCNINGRTQFNNEIRDFSLEIRNILGTSDKGIKTCFNLVSEEKKAQVDLIFRKNFDSNYFIKASLKKIDNYLYQIIKNFFCVDSVFSKFFNIKEGHISTNLEAKIYDDKITDVTIKKFIGKNLVVSLYDEKIKLFAKLLRANAFINLSDEDLFSKISSKFVMQKSGGSFFVNEGMEINLKDIEGEINVDDGVVVPSSLSGYCNNIKWDIDLNGILSELCANLKISGDLSQLMQFFPGNLKENKEKFVGNISLRKKKIGASIYGNIKIEEEIKKLEDIVFGIELKDLYKPNVFSYKTFLDLISVGWVRAENIQMKKWASIKELPFYIQGVADLAVFYHQDKLLAYLKAEKLKANNKSFAIEIDSIGKRDSFLFQKHKQIQGCWDRKKQKFEMQTPKFNGKISIKNNEILVSNAEIKTKDEKIILEVPEAKSKGILIKGSVEYDLINFSEQTLKINARHVVADLNLLKKSLLAGFFPSQEMKGKILGEFSAYKNFAKKNEDWKIFSKGKIEDLSLFLAKQTIIDKFTTDFLFDSSKSLIETSNSKGILTVKDQGLAIHFPKLKKEGDIWQFDLQVDNKTWNIFRLKGQAFFKEEKILLEVDPSLSHWFGMDINIPKWEMKRNFELSDFYFHSNISSFQLISQIRLILDSGVISFDDFSFNNDDIDGDFSSSISYKNGNLNYLIRSKDISFFNKKYNDFFISGKKEKEKKHEVSYGLDEFHGSIDAIKDGNIWKIEKAQLLAEEKLSINLNGSFHTDSSVINLNVTNIKADPKQLPIRIGNDAYGKIDGLIQGNGFITVNLPINGKLEVDGDIKLEKMCIGKIEAVLEKPINVHYSQKEGLVMHGIDVNIYHQNFEHSLINCKVKQIFFFSDEKQWLLKGSRIQYPCEIMPYFIKNLEEEKSHIFLELYDLVQEFIDVNKDIDLSGDIRFSSDLSFIQIFSPKTNFSINEQNKTCKDLFLEYDNKKCKFDFLFPHENEYLKISSQMNFSNKISGHLQFCRLQEEFSSEHVPLTVQWSHKKNIGICIDSICGYFCGIDAFFHIEEIDLDKKLINLLGSAKIDFSKLTPILPYKIKKHIQNIKIGKGYAFKGRITLPLSSPKWNRISGIFYAKQFELYSYVFKTLMANVDISPKEIVIEDINLSDKSVIVRAKKFVLKNTDGWEFSLPELSVCDLRPSLLKRKDSPMEKIKPLLVRKMELKDLKGSFEDKKTITGNGKIHFINSFKRNNSIFDIPADVLGRIVGLDLDLLIPVVGNISFSIENEKCIFTELKDAYSQGKRSKFFFVEHLPFIDFTGKIDMHIRMKQYVLFKLTENFMMSINGNISDPNFRFHKKRGFP